MQDLKNKVVFITGSSIGIGKEDALLFAKEEAIVVITYYKDKKEAEEVDKECKKLGAADTLVLYLNVLDNKSIRDCVKTIVDKFGEISILINNAGVYIKGQVEDMTFDQIEEQIRTNVEGLIKVTNVALPHIKDLIINIGSGAGLEGYGGIAPYSGTKFAVRGFTQGLADERPDLKVYAVNPGVTATRMADFKGTPPEKVAEVIVNLAKGQYTLPSGSDVNIWDYV